MRWIHVVPIIAHPNSSPVSLQSPQVVDPNDYVIKGAQLYPVIDIL